MPKPKNKPRPIPFPPLGKTVKCRVITRRYECEIEIPVNDKTRKAEYGIFTLDVLNGATIRTAT